MKRRQFGTRLVVYTASHLRPLLTVVAVASLSAGVAFVGLPRTAQAVGPITQTYFPGAEGTFVVPVGVTSINVIAHGAQGSDNARANSFGGYGASVSATIAVSPLETLYVDVGSDGGVPTGGLSGTQSSGGSGGTRETSDESGGGGGASLVSTCTLSDVACTSKFYSAEPRLIVAGGGGGGGGYGGCSGGNGAAGVGHGQGPGDTASSFADCNGGGGGDNGTGSSGVATGDETGGSGATPSAVGAAGIDTDSSCGLTEPSGSAGAGPVGGGGYDSTGQSKGLGGGGGGGYYGGGGGATDLLGCDGEWGAGGGAGSSYVTADSTNVTYGNDTTNTPEVIISTGRAFPGGDVPAGNPGRSFVNWTDTTSYSGFTCDTEAPSYGNAFYENNTATAIYSGDLVVPGTSSEIDTPSGKTLQCSFQTTEHPPTNQFTSGTTGCLARTGNTSYFWFQTENTTGLITLRCLFRLVTCDSVIEMNPGATTDSWHQLGDRRFTPTTECG